MSAPSVNNILSSFPYDNVINTLQCSSIDDNTMSKIFESICDDNLDEDEDVGDGLLLKIRNFSGANTSIGYVIVLLSKKF